MGIIGWLVSGLVQSWAGRGNRLVLWPSQLRADHHPINQLTLTLTLALIRPFTTHYQTSHPKLDACQLVAAGGVG